MSIDPASGLPLVHSGAAVYWARERVPVLAAALAVLLQAGPVRWAGAAMADGDFAYLATELAHEGRILLGAAAQSTHRWCQECGDPLASLTDKLTGACQYCRWDAADRRQDFEDEIEATDATEMGGGR